MSNSKNTHAQDSKDDEKRDQQLLKRKIKTVFQGSGFEFIPTNGHQMHIGRRDIEIDSLFIYENVWLLCEDTVTKNRINDHIRGKNEAAAEIRNNLSSLVEELSNLFADRTAIINKHDVSRIKLYYLYFTLDELSLTKEEIDRFSELVFVSPKTLNYLQWITQCIRHSAKNEIFRFLKINSSDIGAYTSSSTSSHIKAPIIYPRFITGLDNNVRIVSFMVSAEDLLDTCYVLRKDDWTESILLYQRLIDNHKIKKIREFLESEGVAFYNNIIVGLPDSVRFCDNDGNYKRIEEITDFDSNYTLVIPKELNSICVIDGQHRIFAHYDSGTDSIQEQKIAKLRKELHLLVTGLVFPNEMSVEERARFQSKIFLDINSNAKPVPQNVLLQIKRIQNPIADESIAQFVIERLNSHGVFQNMFQVSTLEKGKIRTASIVRFALRYLVTINPSDGKQSLFTYWTGNKDKLLNAEKSSIEEYVNYCASVLQKYFSAIKNNFRDQWDDENSKLLSVISINGFIIAMTRQLPINNVKDYGFYDNIFKNWSFDFSKDSFMLSSSQYRKFSNIILQEAFRISADAIETI